MGEKRLAKAISAAILFVILLFVCVHVIFACDCAGPGNVESEYSQANAVFAGKVIGIEEAESGENHKVRFKIIKSYKGIATEQFEMFSTFIGVSCEYPFVEDEEYLVYINNLGKASTCGRTKKLSEAKEDLDVLNGMIFSPKVKE